MAQLAHPIFVESEKVDTVDDPIEEANTLLIFLCGRKFEHFPMTRKELNLRYISVRTKIWTRRRACYHICTAPLSSELRRQDYIECYGCFGYLILCSGGSKPTNKDAQARDLPDSDSSWWQSSKDVSDPFAKVTISISKVPNSSPPNLVENSPTGSVDAGGREDCGDPVRVEFPLPSLGGRVSPSPVSQCCYNQDLYSRQVSHIYASMEFYFKREATNPPPAVHGDRVCLP